jgi:hypothetical protein
VVEKTIPRMSRGGSRRRSSVFILPDFHAIISLHGIDGRRPQFKNSAPGRTECRFIAKIFTLQNGVFERSPWTHTKRTVFVQIYRKFRTGEPHHY